MEGGTGDRDTPRADAQAASIEGPLPHPGDVPRPREQSPGACFLSALCMPHMLPASCSPCLPLRSIVLRGLHWAFYGFPCLCQITRHREQKALRVFFQIHARGLQDHSLGEIPRSLEGV